MISDRRHFLMAGAAAWAMLPGFGFAQTPVRVLSPERFGAKGDGRTDDTQALQICLDAAGPGDIVRLRKGAVYRVDTNWKPTHYAIGGLRLKSGQILELNGAELRALPSREVHGAVVQGFRTHGWRLRGPGRITGERHIHLGTTGEWGIGVVSMSSTGWEVTGIEINGCWGDGILVWSVGSGYSEDFLIDSVKIWDCRRNGISVVHGRNGRIRRVDISKINGTGPFGGIDLEPDDVNRPNRNITISDGRIGGDVGVGIYATVANEDILISNMEVAGWNSGIILAPPLTGLTISNCRVHSSTGNTEGAAIRTIGDPHKFVGVHIRNNRLTGGGYFVIDVWGEGYRDVIVANNEIRASNRGTQGIARVHHSVFTGNECVIERDAGKEGEFFIHLQGATHGRNVFRNLSPHAMHSALRGGQDIGGDTYPGPNLVRRWEPI